MIRKDLFFPEDRCSVAVPSGLVFSTAEGRWSEPPLIRRMVFQSEPCDPRRPPTSDNLQNFHSTYRKSSRLCYSVTVRMLTYLLTYAGVFPDPTRSFPKERKERREKKKELYFLIHFPRGVTRMIYGDVNHTRELSQIKQ